MRPRPFLALVTAIALLATLVFSTNATATTTLTFTSNAQVDTWDPIFPSVADPNWSTTTCVPVPAVGLGASWVNPHKAYDFGTNGHPWQGGAGFSADWINAWSNLYSQGPSGQSWTKYSTQISGTGDFVLNLLADNCSWIYLDGNLVGFQGTDLSQRTYPVHLNGTHNLSFLIFDGGGLAGGEYRLETNTSTIFPTTTTVTFGSGPFVYNGSPFAATATVMTGSVIQAVTATVAYSGDCTNAGTSCTATATYAGDATHTGSTGTANITIDKAPSTTSVSFGAGPFVYSGSPFTATAVVSPSGSAPVLYSGDCTNAGTSCTATATYPGDANHTGSTGSANITITYAICAPKSDEDGPGEGADEHHLEGVRSGRTIPVKIQVCDAGGRNIGSKALQVRAVSISPTGTLQDSGNANRGNLFRFDDHTYMFNLQTKGLAAGAYTLDYMIGSDPTVYHFTFSIRSDKDSGHRKADD